MRLRHGIVGAAVTALAMLAAPTVAAAAPGPSPAPGGLTAKPVTGVPAPVPNSVPREPGDPTYHIWLQIKSGSTQVGTADLTLTAGGPNRTIKTCVTDSAGTNGKAAYVKVTLDFAEYGSSALALFKNTAAGSTTVCRTDAYTNSAPFDYPFFVRVDKGECSGTTCTKYDSDVAGWGDTCSSGVYAPQCSFHTTNNGIALRYSTGPNGDACDQAPSPTNCDSVSFYLNTGDQFWILCQQKGGQTVSGNPYWLRVFYGTGSSETRGWIPSWYLSYPYNWVDDWPYCAPSNYYM